LKALDILSYEDREVSMMGKKGSKKTVRKAHRESAAYLRKGPKKSKGSKGSK